MQIGYHIIPETITVHLGDPNEYAINIQMPFIYYIKNVASSSIYPTWPESAIRAIIYAQISFALNRIYSGHYRSQGYNFDITNSPKYDQKYVAEGVTFDNINKIVDEIFDSNILKKEFALPFFSQYCDGTTTVCDGLSQWGSVYLAENGYTPIDILRYYYGDEINVETDVPVGSVKESYPGAPIKLGGTGSNVSTIKTELGSIRKNYPAIPEIKSQNDVFDVETENAVKEFQRIFNLTPNGIVDKGTWYTLKNVYKDVENLEELYLEALTYEDISTQYGYPLQIGNLGIGVRTLQNLLGIIGYFDPDIPVFAVDDVFGSQTESSVIAFQKKFGLTPDGVVKPDTWITLKNVYINLIKSLPPEIFHGRAAVYPGYVLSLGQRNDDVENLQTYLSTIADYYPWAVPLDVSGYFDNDTYEAVKAFQKEHGFQETGVVGATTWHKISELYNKIITKEIL